MVKESRLEAWGIALVRIVAGAVFVIHGGQKLFYYGIPRVMKYFGTVGVPAPELVAPIVTAIELLGGLALVLGFGTRLAALFLAMDMIGVILTVKLSGGFFAPSGFEYELTLLFACIALIMAGPGAASLRAVIRKRA